MVRLPGRGRAAAPIYVCGPCAQEHGYLRDNALRPTQLTDEWSSQRLGRQCHHCGVRLTEPHVRVGDPLNPKEHTT